MRGALLLSFLLAATFLAAQGQSPAPPPPSPDAKTPAAQQNADQQPANQQPANQQPADQQNEQPKKKSLKQRLKDQVTDPWCVHLGNSPCYDVARPKQDSDGDEQETAQANQQKQPGPGKNQPAPRSDTASHDGEFSSSRDTIIDLSPPPDDAKKHPESSMTPDDDIAEFHKWDPHRAAKDIEVGDYYFRRKNYQAALSRYEEALEFKPNDAIATFRMAEAEEKLQQLDDARQHYADYLRILPKGPLAEDARKALARLGAPVPTPTDSGQVPNQPPTSAAARPKSNLKQHLKNQLTDFCVTAVTRNCPAKPPVLEHQ
jgi:tetratricopeptide (TPR) repeat protein